MDIMQELEQAGAVLLDRHFVYKSHKHGSGYINPDKLLPLLPTLQGVGEQLTPDPTNPDVVLGPDFGGNYLAFQMAEALCRQGRPAKWVATKKTGKDDFVIEPDRGFEEFLPGAIIWVAEDLLTTGSSVAKVCRLAESHGATVAGVSVVVNRGNVTAADIGVPALQAIASVNFMAVDANVCFLCETNVPVVEDIGHGAKFKEEHPNYDGGYVKLQG